MSRTDIVFYMHVHQPYRVKHYSVFEAGRDHCYFNDESDQASTNNKYILDKVSDKSYIPTNRVLMHLLETHPEFRFSLSISGVLLDQLEVWRPDVLKSFQELVATGRVEIIGETYYHSLAFFYDSEEFESQVNQHSETVERLLNYKPHSFRNTELSYNNDLGKWCDEQGYDAVITEGWDPILGWRSPNYVYKPVGAKNTKLLVKNYRLSDDIAFRFGNREWSGWPMTAEKFTHWIHESTEDADIVNLFMDYETFGEHQWIDTGIFEFLKYLPSKWMINDSYGFKTISEAAKECQAQDELDMPYTVTWADTERDLTAWTGNAMQTEALRGLYDLKKLVLSTKDVDIIRDWRKLQTSDHFYYMCTKWWNDGDVHAYFSPYNSPYEAQMNFMNALLDLKTRLANKGIS